MVFMGCWPALVGPLAMAWKLTGRGASWHWIPSGYTYTLAAPVAWKLGGLIAMLLALWLDFMPCG